MYTRGFFLLAWLQSSMSKSTPDEIRQRFDQYVDKFSNLETGQPTTMDAPLVLDLIAQCAAAVNLKADSLLDIGCGAGNYTLKLMQFLKLKKVSLVDLSQPMLERARERISAADPNVQIRTMQGDIRQLDLGEGEFDVVTAAAVLHHLRTDSEWRDVFAAIHASLVPGGSFWVSDLVDHEIPGVRKIIWERYGKYLEKLKGEQFRRDVFGYIEKEDTPRAVGWQLEMLRGVGFSKAEVLHANACFAAYVGVR